MPIDPDFKSWFLRWCKNKSIYFVTGSNKEKTVEQIGRDMWLLPCKMYQSCGNEVYSRGELVSYTDFSITNELRLFLRGLLKKSPWYGRNKYSINIEKRVGLVNFSTIGRNCSREQRKEYASTENEREDYVRAIMDRFPDLEASIGGEISIDIYKRGHSKAQILRDIGGYSIFFGDGCDGGNDAPLAERADKAYQVEDWEETWDILRSMENKDEKGYYK
jgi:phosphomannomutase